MKEAFKFCPRCGSRGRPDSRRLSCPNCGLDTYFSPKPVQEIILENDQGEYLFCVRGVEPAKGKLDFPGGFVEPDETFEESLRREIKEELGIDMDVSDMEYLHSAYTKYPFQGVEYDVVGTSFWARLPKGAKIVPADDVAGVEFYKLSEIPLDRLAWHTSKQVLKILAEREAKRH